MTLFSKKQTDYFLFLSSMIPLVTHFFLGQKSFIPLLAIWISTVCFAVGIRNVIVRFNLFSQDSNHSFSISLALLAPFLTSVYAYFGTNHLEFLIQALGFLFVLYLVSYSWTDKICTIPLLFAGFIIGLETINSSYVVLWLLLFPIIFYFMRCWSGRNFGSIVTGFALAIWSIYLFYFFAADEEKANNFVLSLGSFVPDLFVYLHSYSIIEWVFISFTAILIIIYYIYMYFGNPAKTIIAHSTLLMYSVLSILLGLFALIDLSHLPNYAVLFSIILAFQLSIQQSYNKDTHEELLVLIVLSVYQILSIFMPIFYLFC